MSPIIVWLFLELWDTVYLLVTSEYVFVAVPWEWVCETDSNSGFYIGTGVLNSNTKDENFTDRK